MNIVCNMLWVISIQTWTCKCYCMNITNWFCALQCHIYVLYITSTTMTIHGHDLHNHDHTWPWPYMTMTIHGKLLKGFLKVRLWLQWNIYIYIYVWKLNQTVLGLDFRAVNFLFFPRRDLNPHHWYTAAPFA